MILAGGALLPGAIGDSILAPTGAVATLLGIVFAIVREWRLGRQQAVEFYKAKATEAAEGEAAEKARADRLEQENTDHIDRLQTAIAELRGRIDTLQRSHNLYIATMTDRHRQELRDVQRRLDVELRHGFRLTTWMAEHGWPLPADLDPAVPEVRPDLGPSAPVPTDELEPDEATLLVDPDGYDLPDGPDDDGPAVEQGG